jgi:hypothetical protein
MSQARTQQIADAIFPAIKDRFEEGDAGELLMTSPVDDALYDIYSDDDTEWYIVIDDEPSDRRDLHGFLSLDAAQRGVAKLIAEQIAFSEAIIAQAKSQGLLPA